MHFRQRLRTIVQSYHGNAFLLFPVPVTMLCSESGQLPDAGAVGDGLDVLNVSWWASVRNSTEALNGRRAGHSRASLQAGCARTLDVVASLVLHAGLVETRDGARRFLTSDLLFPHLLSYNDARGQ